LRPIAGVSVLADAGMDESRGKAPAFGAWNGGFRLRNLKTDFSGITLQAQEGGFSGLLFGHGGSSFAKVLG